MIIKLKDVSKIYPLDGEQVQALDKINLSIDKGEFVAIIGPSGSGKSTLMHIIGLLDTPTSGQVIIQGQNVATLSENQLATIRNHHIGFVFQHFNLLPRTSALDNVILPMMYGKIPDRERRQKATDVLNMVGLGDRLGHHPNQLSGGQQQRVAIARSLVMNPDLILADEPTGNLDSKTGQEIIKLFSDLNKKGHTIILVTHENDVASAAKRQIHLKDGKVVT